MVMQIFSIVLAVHAVSGLISCHYVNVIWEEFWNLLQLCKERHMTYLGLHVQLFL